MSKKEDKRMFNSLLEESKSLDQQVKKEAQPEPKVEAPLTVDPQYVKYAYSLIENEGQYHVISVEFDPNTLVSGNVKKIESNTEKFLMQERLQVLLMGDDLI